MTFRWPNGVECHISGVGSLYLKAEMQESAQVACTFHAVQFSNSAVHIECAIKDLNVDVPSPLNTMLKKAHFYFDGVSSDGRSVSADHVVYGGDFLTREEGRPLNIVGYRARWMRVGQESKDFAVRRFKVVNFAPEFPFDHIFRWKGAVVRMRSVDDFEEITPTLGIRDQCAVTTLIEISEVVGDDALYIVDVFCELLSYTRGTRVQWINYEDLDHANAVLCIYYASRITRRLTPMDLIPEDLTYSFIQGMLEPYAAFREAYDYRKVLGLYLDASDQTDFIDVRAIKTVVLMEAIKALVLEKNPLPPIIATKSKARRFASRMRFAIRDAAEGLELPQPSVDALESKLGGCTHHTFRQCIEQVQSVLRIEVDRGKVSIFIEARNRLIHDAKFLHLAEPGGKHGFQHHAEEYFWLIGFVDRFVLRLIGYRGAYIDRSRRGEVEVPAESS